MALDGIVLSALLQELDTALTGGKIDKINQPEKDELIFHVRNHGKTFKWLCSVEASAPRAHLTDVNKQNPMTPSGLCMLFRKLLVGGKILGFEQLQNDRVLVCHIQHLDDLHDVKEKRLIIELMGRHSNIILVNEAGVIVESVKRVSSAMSSLREVFPGKLYMPPPTASKADPNTILTYPMFQKALDPTLPIDNSLLQSFYGFSWYVVHMLLSPTGVPTDVPTKDLSEHQLEQVYFEFNVFMQQVKAQDFQPVIYLKDNQFHDFHVLPSADGDLQPQLQDSISSTLETFYHTKAVQVRMRQKTADLRKLVQTFLDRNVKKLMLQEKQLEDTKDLDTFKLKGELIQANLYQIEPGVASVSLWNYYTDEMMTFSVNKDRTPIENANNFFDKYQKKKRTQVALKDQIEKTKAEVAHLESIMFSLDQVTESWDISSIRKELSEAGYLKAQKAIKGRKVKDTRQKASKPMHYRNADGFDLYVGRNNEQNEMLSMKMAGNNDWWFHTKDVPGSHVIVLAKGRELTDRTYEEAAAVAAYYSKAKDGTKVTVDYTQKKNLKKPSGSALGYVIYHTNYALHITPSVEGLETIVDD